MAHYAFLDEDNIVVQVITGIDETKKIEDKNPEAWYEDFWGLTCKRTSYNGNIRKNFAGIGFRYDETLDAFIPPQPYSSWVLDEETCQWKAPVPYPEDGRDYFWDEDVVDWTPMPNDNE